MLRQAGVGERREHVGSCWMCNAEVRSKYFMAGAGECNKSEGTIIITSRAGSYTMAGIGECTISQGATIWD